MPQEADEQKIEAQPQRIRRVPLILWIGAILVGLMGVLSGGLVTLGVTQHTLSRRVPLDPVEGPTSPDDASVYRRLMMPSPELPDPSVVDRIEAYEMGPQPDIKTVAIVGGGNIVRPILGRLHEENHPMPRVTVSTRGSQTAINLAEKYGVVAMSNNKEVVAKAVQDQGVVLFALKVPVTLPAMQEVAEVLQSVAPERRPLVMSVSSSTKLSSMEQVLGQETSIVRAMPNTPSQIGAGVTALFANAKTTPDQRKFASDFFEKLGYVAWMDREEQMDTMTVHTGCAPAVVFRLMEWMIASAGHRGLPQNMAEASTKQLFLEASQMTHDSKEPTHPGVKLILQFMDAMTAAAITHGIPKDIAEASTKQVFFGASRMALAAGEPLPKLRTNITTKGGVTERELASLETHSQFFQEMIDRTYETQSGASDEDIHLLFQYMKDAYAAGKQRCQELGGTATQANPAIPAGATDFFKAEKSPVQDATAERELGNSL